MTTIFLKKKSILISDSQTTIFPSDMNKLEVKNVSKSFDGKKVISDVSIELNKGELVCLLGVSGGGKTTLFNIISGLLSPDSGQVLLDGKDITNRPGNISYMLQKDLLLPYRTIEDNVALPLLLKGMKKRMLAGRCHRCLNNSVLSERRRNTHLSIRVVCVSVRHFCGHICIQRTLLSLTSRSLRLTP